MTALTSDPDAALLRTLYARVTEEVAGDVLVARHAQSLPRSGRRRHVLGLGKVAVPMWRGLVRIAGATPVASALLITTEGGPDAAAPGCDVLPSDHPEPSERSEAAALRAQSFVRALHPEDELVVLLSGGGSALMAQPLPGLTLDEKRRATRAVARAGASIHELNAVRKHLSAVKGGRLALACPAPVLVLAMSDVVGSDPGTVASGPFSADSSRFADAWDILRARVPDGVPTEVVDTLQAGIAGRIPETPKPGDARLSHVTYEVIAGPEDVRRAAARAVRAAGWADVPLAADTEMDVARLAELYALEAQRILVQGTRAIGVGNGEPTLVVRGQGRGGRATHLALEVARRIAGLGRVAFLAAGTDARDGSASGAGAVVTSTTWGEALAAGLDPAGALAACDSGTLLAQLGCIVQGPGTSNLLDLHLLLVEGESGD